MKDRSPDALRQALADELGLSDPFDLARLDTFARTLTERNALYDTDALVAWVDELRRTVTMKVTPCPVKELRRWSTTPTGEIVHESGGFFQIVGVRVEGAEREVTGWDQPLVAQQKMGVLGILRTTENGTHYYLLQGKAEPGNWGLIQVSPTLQATYANMEQVHHGKRPAFMEYFVDGAPYRVIYKRWLAEDGGRFLGKTNLNMIVEAEGLLAKPVPHDFRWFTLRQVKEMLLLDNYIGPHVRSILAHL